MHKHGSLAIVSPWHKSSRHITHSPLSSFSTSSSSNTTITLITWRSTSFVIQTSVARISITQQLKANDENNQYVEHSIDRTWLYVRSTTRYVNRNLGTRWWPRSHDELSKWLIEPCNVQNKAIVEHSTHVEFQDIQRYSTCSAGRINIYADTNCRWAVIKGLLTN